jgi:hypothetical protein
MGVKKSVKGKSPHLHGIKNLAKDTILIIESLQESLEAGKVTKKQVVSSLDDIVETFDQIRFLARKEEKSSTKLVVD